MSSDTAVPAAPRMPSDLTRRESGLGLAGLIDVLDRADVLVIHGRPRSRRRAASRTDAYRRTAGQITVRRAPLRSVLQAPRARTVPAAAAAVARVAAVRAVPQRPGRHGWAAFTHRMALWGAGSDGEHLAWPAAVPAATRPPARRAAPAAAPAAPAAVRRACSRPALLVRLVRRAALWGAGTDGAHLAWPATGPARRDPRAQADRPVLLRELPSTPTIQPAASSPAAVLLPDEPVATGSQGARPETCGAVPVPGVRPCGPAERSEAPGWPMAARPLLARSSPVATGSIRARGDPVPPPVRGSPPPARRVRSSGSTWSSFP